MFFHYIFPVSLHVFISFILLKIAKPAYDAFMFFLFLIKTQIVPLMLFRKVYRERVYKELQAYLDRLLILYPELSHLKNVKLYVTGELDFQGRNHSNHRIDISHGWIIAASIHPDCLEYAKSVICHELGHICSANTYGHVDTTILSWLEELNADRLGCLFYGGAEPFIARFEQLKVDCPFNNTVTTHPSLDIRIRYLAENIVPTLENVTLAYNEHRQMCEKK